MSAEKWNGQWLEKWVGDEFIRALGGWLSWFVGMKDFLGHRSLSSKNQESPRQIVTGPVDGHQRPREGIWVRRAMGLNERVLSRSKI